MKELTHPKALAETWVLPAGQLAEGSGEGGSGAVDKRLYSQGGSNCEKHPMKRTVGCIGGRPGAVFSISRWQLCWAVSFAPLSAFVNVD